MLSCVAGSAAAAWQRGGQAGVRNSAAAGAAGDTVCAVFTKSTTARAVWLTLLSLAVTTTVAGLPASSAPIDQILGARSGSAVPGQYTVVLDERGSARSGEVAPQAANLAARYGGRVNAVYERTLAGFSVAMSETQALRLAADPAVAYIQQDQWLQLDDTQENLPSYGLDRVDQRNLPLDGGYSYDFGPSPVSVYIVDSGIRISHEDFGGRAVHGWDFIADVPAAGDCHGHGTHVAGTVGGTRYGVAKNVRLVALRAFDCNGRATSTSVQSAVEWVTVNAVKPAVVNMSLGPRCTDGSGNPAACPEDKEKALVTAVKNSIAAGINYVVSAGNGNIDACGAPLAAIATATAVGATDSTDSRWTSTATLGSNWGACVDIWAPGHNIVSAGITSDTVSRTTSGTSMAAPHVTGAMALMLTRPGWANKTPAELKAALTAESTPNVLSGLNAGSPNKLVYTAPPPFAGGSQVALARNADGRLAMYGVNIEGTMFARYQTHPNSSTWTEWQSSVEPSWYSVCAETDGLPHLKVVGLRRNTEIWHRSQTFPNLHSYSMWRGIDGLANTCAMASDGAKLELFVTNGQGHLYRRTQTAPGSAGFTPWAPVSGAQVLRRLAAERNGEGLVELFGLTRTGEIWHCWMTATNCGPATWVRLDGQASSIAVARNGSGTISIFAVNSANQLFVRDAAAGTNNWFSWSQLDVTAAVGTVRTIAAEARQDGRIELVAVNSLGQIWSRTQLAPSGNSFGPWVQLSGLLRP